MYGVFFLVLVGQYLFFLGFELCLLTGKLVAIGQTFAELKEEENSLLKEKVFLKKVLIMGFFFSSLSSPSFVSASLLC